MYVYMCIYRKYVRCCYEDNIKIILQGEETSRCIAFLFEPSYDNKQFPGF